MHSRYYSVQPCLFWQPFLKICLTKTERHTLIYIQRGHTLSIKLRIIPSPGGKTATSSLVDFSISTFTL